MKVSYDKVKVLENENIVSNIYKLVVEDKKEIKAGQFYMLKVNNSLLGRPISICEKEDDKLTFLYAVVGKGTKEISNFKKEDEIFITGPLGNGFNVYENLGKVALVCGGIGTAPMVQVAKELKSRNNASEIDVYAGFRDEIYLKEELEKYSDNLNISTNTGSFGHKGFVTDLLNPENYDVVLCCGPEIMMKKVIEMCKDTNTKVFVSMEKHMACGVGACLVCTCKTKDGHKRACKDGPVFDGNYVEL
ncbi:dihydroorotate dehydrogenase electron transfer subunit [Clostridium chrysemydis]|uniref:dihydroorotate dehydrogenase electron transfer subunit n=1 Tax=Clostridium chrysemydis TaxID=2665504 RepID=UPI001884430A|nr:dihydroorotate dehydrogenase electron transfer subunit [Clostridium chrysemydis]